MKIVNLVNPSFIFKNRKRILPYLARKRAGIVYPWTLWPYKNRHRGERCFIIGNGPSLRISDLEKLAGEITFAANKIYLAFNQTSWRPSYYVAEDDHFIRQHYQELGILNGTVKFISNSCGDLVRRQDHTIKYPRRLLELKDFPKFSDNAAHVVYCGYMVTYISLQLAYFMGFSEVYLVGVDFDYAEVRDDLNSFEHQAGHASDHFTANYFAPGEIRSAPRLSFAERAMRCAKDFYESHNRKIWNATRGGKLEVFDRVCLEEVLSS